MVSGELNQIQLVFIQAYTDDIMTYSSCQEIARTSYNSYEHLTTDISCCHYSTLLSSLSYQCCTITP